MRNRKGINTAEFLIIIACVLLFGSSFISKTDFFYIKDTPVRQMQFAVDAYVAKHSNMPTQNKVVKSCLIPEKIKTEEVAEYLQSKTNDNHIYFVDYYGKVWKEKEENLLNVFKQEEFLVFNNTHAERYDIWEIKNGDCSKIELIESVKYENKDVLFYKVRNLDNEYLIQPIYKDYKGMPVGAGFNTSFLADHK